MGGNDAASSDDDIMIIDDNGNMSSAQPQKSNDQDDGSLASNRLLSQYMEHPISEHDYKSLEYGEFLNDNVVNFYLCYLQNEKLDSMYYNDVHIYSSHFFSRLKGTTPSFKNDKATRIQRQQQEYQRVKSWTRKIDIFSKRMLIFPVCEDEHWYLIIVCNPGLVCKITYENMRDNRNVLNRKGLTPNIIVLDSLGSSHKMSVEKIRSYMEYEHKERLHVPQFFSESKIKFNVPVVPLQTNSCDCGVYLLHYIEKIFESLYLFLATDMPNLTQWFRAIEIVKKRRHVASIIQSKVIVKEEVIENEEGSNNSNLFPDLRFERRPSKLVTEDEKSPI